MKKRSASSSLRMNIPNTSAAEAGGVASLLRKAKALLHPVAGNVKRTQKEEERSSSSLKRNLNTKSEPTPSVRIQSSFSEGACCRRAVIVGIGKERHHNVMNFPGFQVNEVVICRVIHAALKPSKR